MESGEATPPFSGNPIIPPELRRYPFLQPLATSSLIRESQPTLCVHNPSELFLQPVTDSVPDILLSGQLPDDSPSSELVPRQLLLRSGAVASLHDSPGPEIPSPVTGAGFGYNSASYSIEGSSIDTNSHRDSPKLEDAVVEPVQNEPAAAVSLAESSCGARCHFCTTEEFARYLMPMIISESSIKQPVESGPGAESSLVASFGEAVSLLIANVSDQDVMCQRLLKMTSSTTRRRSVILGTASVSADFDVLTCNCLSGVTSSKDGESRQQAEQEVLRLPSPGSAEATPLFVDQTYLHWGRQVRNESVPLPISLQNNTSATLQVRCRIWVELLTSDPCPFSLMCPSAVTDPNVNIFRREFDLEGGESKTVRAWFVPYQAKKYRSYKLVIESRKSHKKWTEMVVPLHGAGVISYTEALEHFNRDLYQQMNPSMQVVEHECL